MDKSKKLIYFFIFLGLAFRLLDYFYNKSLWLDETYVALNAIHNTYSGIAKDLLFEHEAPILFMWIQRSMYLLFGNSEYVFRFYPQMCSLASVYLFYKVSKDFISERSIPIAVFLFSTCAALIHYSAEGKPYSGDVFLALLCFCLTIDIFKNGVSTKRAIVFGLVGALAIWAAYSSVFVLASVGLVTLIPAIQKKAWSDIRQLSIMYLSWAFSFGLFYYVAIFNAVKARYVIDVFTQFYVPVPLSFESLKWLVNMGYLFLSYLPIHEFSVVFALIGIASIAKVDKRKSFLLVLPLFFAIVASTLHQYPLWQRCLLFSIPAIFLLTSEGLVRAIDFLEKKYFNVGKSIGYLCLLMVLFFPALGCVANAINPRSNQEVRDGLKYIKSNLQKGDVVYIHKHLQYGYKFYASKVGLIEVNELETPLDTEDIKRVYEKDGYKLVIGESSRYNPENKFHFEEIIPSLDNLRGNKRVWLFLSDMKYRCYYERNAIVDYYDKSGKRLDYIKLPGIEVFLYDLS